MDNKEFSNTENITDFERRIDNEYECWFKKICLQSVIEMCEKDPIVWKGRSLDWDASHEILAYHIFSDKNLTIDNLLFLSNHRYELLDKLWPKGELTKKQVEDFYIKSKEILPWGHGVFIADHNVHERRMNWLRRVRILKMIQKLSIDSICDYGAGGGHTSLLAKAMGFKRIIHHEYSAFHPFVKWRSDQIGNFGYHNKIFELSRAEDGLKLVKPVNAVVCMDVAEHVWDPIRMIEEIYNSLEQDGYLIWNSVFGEGISCHLHPELKGKEEKILTDCGFQRVKELNVNYRGHSGLYKKMKKLKFINMPIKKRKIKPKILFIVDAPNWAHDNKTINLQSQLSDQYDIEKCFCDNIQVENIENADIVVIYYWGQLLNENMQKLQLVFSRNKHKFLLGICSHNEMSCSNRSIALKTLKEYASAIFVNNKLLFDEFAPYFDIPVFYTPNGVDTTFYKPLLNKYKSESLRVGWAGSLKNHGDIRGYYDYILPAVESIDKVELITAAREDFWRNQQQMLEFYNSIDVYICASRSEGTPNPCLEAAACGLPLLTTYVGNMPELIENGVNGIFIKRDINDIVQKLKLMRDNQRLQLQLSKNARERSIKWDWKIKAKNYKHMFEAILAETDQKKTLFHSSDQVYLASADKMDMVLKNCQQFIKVPNRNINSYISVIGGMSGLNYLCLMAPKTITFFDTNFCAVEYIKCMLEIISISNGCRDFISRVFCRSIDMFLNENNYDDLTVYNQNEYLEMNIDKKIYLELMSLLTPYAKRIYKKYIEPHLSKKILSGVRNCRQLVPCHPANERVPVGGGEENGWNELGKLVPNLNTFFYGNGWLSSDDVFNYIKDILKTTKIKYMAFDLFRDELDFLTDFSGHVVIHCSNIDDWYPEKWSEWKQKVIEKSIRKRGELSVITTNGGVKHSFLDPHIKAFECIKPYVYGKIVEVTHKVPWGFHEFKKDTIIFYEYINGNNPISDTTIIHNLVGEGINHNIFEEVYRIALKKSHRVIILEHNQESLDWKKNANNSSYMTISQLNDKLKKIAIPNKVFIHPAIKSPGYYDLSRNIIFVVDTFNFFNTKKYEVEINFRKNKNTVKEIKSEKRCIVGNICNYSESPFGLRRNNNIKMLDKVTLKKKRAEKESDTKKNTLLNCQSSDPYVSVIVPTFNRPTKLAEALKSILTQTFKNYEIIVVNDSGQDVEPVVTALNQNNIITYVRHCCNKGLAAARNTGIKIARGKYIAYLDDDDIYYPEHLSTLFEHLENSDYKVAYTDAYRSHKSYKNKECIEVKKDLPFSNDFDCDRMLVSNFIPVLCFMHEKFCLEKIGYFDEKLSSHEDWDFWIRMSQKYHFLHIKKITAEFSWFTDGSTMTSGKRDDMLVTFKAVYHKHADLVAEKPHIAKIQRENIKILEKQIINKNKKKCSIIIPVYNKIELTRNCLEALFNNTPVDIIEVIVVDNNSTDGTNEYLSLISEKVKVIKNKENLGFAIACNQGAKNSIGEYLVFLNNDTEVQSDWLNPLCEIIEQDKSVAAVGSKMLFPDNKIQHAGVVIINDQKIPDPLVARHIYYRQDCNYHMANVMSTYQALTAACMLVRKSSFKAVGGFDEKYWNGYEDIDLCFKLQKHGSLLIYQPKSVVIHYESQSGPERFNRTQHNIERLHKKWIGEITPDIIIKPSGKIIENWSGFIRPYQIKKPESPKLTDSTVLNKNFTSIIILTYNQVEYTKRCLESILTNTPGPFELIIVDNGSTDGTVEYLESQMLNKCNDLIIKIIKNNENKGFAGGNNQGIVASSGEYILILNNDVVVTPGWLERMIRCCEKRPEIGIVGPISNYVSGPQLVEPVDYNLGSLEGLNRFSEKISTINAKKSTRLLRVVGFCMLIKRSVIEKIGGMDDRYGIGNFEDDDFSIRAALSGFESWMVEDCFVHHFGSRTFIGEKIDYRKSLLQNWKIFIKKWGLPEDLPYGSSYSISQMKVNSFDPIYHYIPLSLNDENSINNSFDIRPSVVQEYSLVSSSINIKDIKTAIEKLQKFAKRYKNFAPVYNDLGVLYYKSGGHKSALEHYRIALNHDRGNISFRKNLADLLAIEFAEYEEALQHYVTVLASDPKDVEALSATGHICARLERYDDAAEFYERVLEIEPNNSDAANWVAKMRERRSVNSLEERLNDRYLTLLSEIDYEDLAGAIQIIENFIEMYPYYGQAHNDLGVLYYKNKSNTKVLACYLKAVELEPENVTFLKNIADFLYVEEGRVEEALENYVAVLRIKPDDVETLLITGHICTAIERFEDAMSFYHKVLDLEPQNLDARQNLKALEKRQISMPNQEAESEKNPGDKTEIIQGEPHASSDDMPIIQASVIQDFIKKADSVFQQERIDQAVDIFLKAIAVNPLDGSTYIELARQLVNHGRHENALEVLAEMPANQPEALGIQKMLLEGYGQEGLGNYAAAKKCNDGVLDREPENAKALNLIGILAYRNGDKETAEQRFKRAIELDSEYGEPHTNLGSLVWEKGEPKMALEHYERGFSNSPTDIDVANAYHEAVSDTGEYKRAEKVARRALKKYPQCRKVRYLLIDTLIRQEKTEEALKEMEAALSAFGCDEGLLDTALAFRERVGKIKKTGSAKNPGVSLCMIVKDEEANLARCLASVKPIVDQMIVVDTGSTDRTRDIAEFFGARIYDFEWSDDFAEARNFSLSKAKGGWILILDADEVISSKDYAKFRSIVRRRPRKPIAYSITTRNYCTLANNIGWETNIGEYPAEEAGFGWLPSTKVRLFYGRSRIRFEGAVHEMVDTVLKRAGIPVKSCNIPVHHYGRLDTNRMDRKGKIYYDIGRKKLEESNDDHAAVRELATQATILGKNEEAVDLWHRFVKMSPPDRAVAEAHINLATLYLRLQDYGAAKNVSEKVLSKLPEMKEARYNLALSELYLGSAEKTFDVLKHLVEDNPLYPPAQFILAATCFIIGQKEEAKGLLENLKKGPFGPVLTRSFAELVRDLTSASRFDYAQQLLDAALENEIVDAQILAQLSLTLPSSPQTVAVAG